ncbi:BT_3987 domain-containing protein [Zobellia nedashkovskayae]
MKLRYFIIPLVLLLSCEKYEDFNTDTVGYTTIYFPQEELPRSMISGEGMSIDIGVFLGGVKNNALDRVIQYELEDQTFLDDYNTLKETDYTLLPSEYYNLSNVNEIVVPQGSLQGFVTVAFDSLTIARDTAFTDFKYALPFKLPETTSGVDSVLIDKQTTIIPVRLMNTFEGIYWQIGDVKKFFNVDRVVDDFISYGDSLNLRDTPLRRLITTGMNTVLINGVANLTNEDEIQMELLINVDNTVTIVPKSEVYQVSSNGKNTWDPIKRIFTLNYKYEVDDFTYEVNETLSFRNRNRDGIDEWRWEGFPGN